MTQCLLAQVGLADSLVQRKHQQGEPPRAEYRRLGKPTGVSMERVDFTQVSQRTSFLQCVHDASQVVGRAGHARVLLEGVLRVVCTYACQAWHLGSVLA